MISLKLQDLKKDDIEYANKFAEIAAEKKRKHARNVGEGSIFFLLIATGAVFVYRVINKELK